jgi:hypothetical protein
MSTSAWLTLALIVTGVLASLLAGRRQGSSRERPRQHTTVVVHKPQAPRPKPARQKQPANRATGLSEAQVRAILKRALGATWEAEQQRFRAQVLEQERKIAARLRQAQRSLDFAELRSLHEQSRQTADLAYTSLGSARSTEQTISENIRDTHRAIDAEQSRGGHRVSALRQALDALHTDRDVIRAHRDRYEQDVQRLNRETARLRDSIGANCGAQGKRWHQALTERTRARKEGRR